SRVDSRSVVPPTPQRTGSLGQNKAYTKRNANRHNRFGLSCMPARCNTNKEGVVLTFLCSLTKPVRVLSRKKWRGTHIFKQSLWSNRPRASDHPSRHVSKPLRVRHLSQCLLRHRRICARLHG